MANITLPTCICPRCNGAGRSVAAMNYAETQHWDKRGTFSGSGLGIGTGGFGVGMGGGSYSEHREQKTKLAEMFDEPAQFVKPVLSLVVMGAITMMGYSCTAPFGRSVIAMTPEVSGIGSFTEVTDLLLAVMQVVGSLFGLIFGGLMLKRAVTNQMEMDRLNKEVWPKLVHRYNLLRYCANCHILFDPVGRCAEGSEAGFSKMMAHLD